MGAEVEEGFFLDLYVNSDQTSFQKAERNVESLREKVASLTGSDLTMDFNFDPNAMNTGILAFKKLLTAAIEEAWKAGVTKPDWLQGQAMQSGLSVSTVWGLSNFSKDVMKTSPDAIINGMITHINELANIAFQGKLSDPKWIASSQLGLSPQKLMGMDAETALTYMINTLVPLITGTKNPTERAKVLQNVTTAVGPEIQSLIAELVKKSEALPSLFLNKDYASIVKNWGTDTEQNKALEENTKAVQEAKTKAESLASQYDSFKTTIAQTALGAAEPVLNVSQNILDWIKGDIQQNGFLGLGNSTLENKLFDTVMAQPSLLFGRIPGMLNQYTSPLAHPKDKALEPLLNTKTVEGMTTYSSVGLNEKGNFIATETKEYLSKIWALQSQERASKGESIDEKKWDIIMGSIYGANKGESEQFLSALTREMLSRIQAKNPSWSNEQIIEEFNSFIKDAVIQLPELMKKYGTQEDLQTRDKDPDLWNKLLNSKKTGSLFPEDKSEPSLKTGALFPEDKGSPSFMLDLFSAPSLQGISSSALSYATHTENMERKSSVDVNIKIGNEKLPTVSVTPGVSSAPVNATLNPNNIMQG